MRQRRWWVVAGVPVLALVAALSLCKSFSPRAAVRTEPLPAPILNPNLSPDGRLLAYSDQDQTLVRLLDLTTGQARDLGIGQAESTLWSPDSRYLRVGGLEDSVYDLQTGHSVRVPAGRAYRWANDGPWVAVRLEDKSTQLWRVGEPAPAPLFSDWVEALVINGNGPSLAVRLTPDGRELVRVERAEAAQVVEERGFHWVAAAPDGRAWVLSRNGGLALYRDGQAPKGLIPEGNFASFSGAWSPDGQWVALFGRTAEGRDAAILIGRDGQSRYLPLTDLDRVYESPSIFWMPDSRSFAYVTRPPGGPILRPANWVHLVDVATGRDRVWRLPYHGVSQAGSHTLRDVQMVNDRFLFATLRETLYRYDLR